MSNPTSSELMYCGLLESLDAEISGEHDKLLYAYEDDGTAGPIRVKGKILVIPTRANLKQPPEFWDKHIAFHPLNEQALRDDSEVLKTLQRLINWKTIKTLSYLAFNLTMIASHPELVKGLNPKQHLLLDALPDANKKTVKFVKDITDASFSGITDHRLIKTFIKKGGIYRDKRYLSLIITRFSIFENGNIDLDNRKILGVKAPKISDLEAIPDLFRLILPHSDVPESYNVPSNDETAPRLHALLGGYVKLARRFNDVLKLFGDMIEMSEFQRIDLSWVEYLDKFSKIRHDIPPLEDDYGEVSKSSKAEDQSGKKLRPGVNIDELGTISESKPTTQKVNSSKPYQINPNRFKNKEDNSSRSNTMNPYLMMQMMNKDNDNTTGKKAKGESTMDPMMMSMLMGGKIDPMMMMLMNKDKEGDGDMDPMMMSMLMNQGGDMDPMMLSMMMGGKIDPMMLMMMNKDKGGDSDGGMDPMMLQMLMSQGGDIDPMQLMMMSGGKIDPMMLMMMNKDKEGGGEIDPMMLMMMNGGKIDPMMMMLMNKDKKAKKGQTVTPKQPAPKSKAEYPVD